MNICGRYGLSRYRIVWIFLLLCAVAVKGPHPRAQTIASSAVTSDTAENIIHKDGVAYEELMWDNDDVLEFVADYKNDRIIIKNRSKEDEKLKQ